MKKKIIRLTESDLTKLVRKIINEVGGYDDPLIMYSHTKNVMTTLVSIYSSLYQDISELIHVITKERGTIDKEDIINFLNNILKDMDHFEDLMFKSIKDFTEDELVNSTKQMIKHLNKFKNHVKMIISFPDSGDINNLINHIMNISTPLIDEMVKYSNTLEKTNNLFGNRFKEMN